LYAQFWPWKLQLEGEDISAMLSKEQLAAYRRLTAGERLALTFEMLDGSLPQLLHGPKDLVDRRFDLLNRQNEERTRRILEGLAGAERQRRES